VASAPCTQKIMKNLNYYKEIIKEKRKNTNFMDFVLDIPSWIPFSFYKNN
jgi:hypothetical protein